MGVLTRVQGYTVCGTINYKKQKSPRNTRHINELHTTKF